VRALETDRKASIWQAFLACFAASANYFYIQRQYTYIVFILRYQKVQNNLSENSWNKRRSNRFYWRHLWRQCLSCYRFFLSLYQKCFIWSM